MFWSQKIGSDDYFRLEQMLSCKAIKKTKKQKNYFVVRVVCEMNVYMITSAKLCLLQIHPSHHRHFVPGRPASSWNLRNSAVLYHVSSLGRRCNNKVKRYTMGFSDVGMLALKESNIKNK